MALTMVGKTVIVTVLPEEQPATYYVAKDDFPPAD